MPSHDIQIELDGLIKLLAQNLYADPDVFLREMVQNAHDSITKRVELAGERGDAPPPGEIRIAIDVAGRRVSITDNGAGLTEREIHDYLSTIGRSGTGELKAELRAGDGERAVALIGQFGIGLLSAFIVADAVEVVTRSAVEGAWRWCSGGGKAYTVEPAERDAVGTTVILALRADHQRYLAAERLRAIVRTYADFIGVPVYVGGEVEPSNAVHAPWHRPAEGDGGERHRRFWARRFPDETPLEIIPVDEAFSYDDLSRPGELCAGRVRGVLGISDRRVPGGEARGVVDLYVARMFVCRGHREVLPPWACFVQGVVECDALTPNAARDNVVRDGVLDAVQRQLGRRVLAHLEGLARRAPLRLVEVMRWHGHHILAMCAQDAHRDFFEAVADLVMLDTGAGPSTVPAYLAQAPAGRGGPRPVYYLAEGGATNQFHLLARAQGIRVFDARAPYAERFLKRYAERWPERARLVQFDVSGSDAIFRRLSDAERAPFRALEVAFAQVFPDMRCVARATEFAPHEMPAVLTETPRARSRREMQDAAGNTALPGLVRDLVQGILDDDRHPLTLHLNVSNPTIKRLAARVVDQWDDVTRHALLALYNNALMLLARAMSPERMREVFKQFGRVTELMLEAAEQEQSLRGDLAGLKAELRARGGAADDQRTPYVSCFVALPFDDAYAPLYDALERALESPPFFWDVVRADEKVFERALWGNVKQHLKQAHCFVAEVSDHNPNVMLEIGRMEALERPLLLLRRADGPDIPADLAGQLWSGYDPGSMTLAGELKAEVLKHEGFADQRGRAHYLSRHTLVGLGVGEAPARALSGAYETCEAFVNADAETVAGRLGLSRRLVQFAQGELRACLDRYRD